MPLFWQFLDKETKEPVHLQRIDDEIREDLGLPPDSKNYSQEYDIITTAGSSIFANGKFNEETFNSIFKDNPKLAVVARKYYCEKYQFICGYVRH
jgi:hypothetical protein